MSPDALRLVIAVCRFLGTVIVIESVAMVLLGVYVAIYDSLPSGLWILGCAVATFKIGTMARGIAVRLLE